jgi:hypothetical protein
MKIPRLLFCLFLLPIALSASKWSMEVGPGFFSPDKSLKKAYEGGWIDYQLETSYAIDCHTEAWIGVNWIAKKRFSTERFYFRDSYSYSGSYSFDSSYYSGSYSFDSSYYSDDSSSDWCYSSEVNRRKQIWILPLSFGSKYFYNLTPRISVYLGAGVVYTYLRIEHRTAYFNEHFSKHGLGAVIKSGLRYDWGKYTFVNLFVDYFHQNFHLSHLEREVSIDRKIMNLSALKIGFTVGVYF